MKRENCKIIEMMELHDSQLSYEYRMEQGMDGDTLPKISILFMQIYQ